MENLRKVIFLVVAGSLGTACGSTGNASGGGPDALDGQLSSAAESAAQDAPISWPEEFTRASLLVADRIVIEGPRGLLDHVALRQDPANLIYSAETVPEGFRQVLKRKDPLSYQEIRAGFDNWELIALDSMLVLERPGDIEVRIIAEGGVWWRNSDQRGPLSGSEELRGEKLIFRGGK